MLDDGSCYYVLRAEVEGLGQRRAGEGIADTTVKNILCGWRKERVCFLSTLPHSSDTLVTGLGEGDVSLSDSRTPFWLRL